MGGNGVVSLRSELDSSINIEIQCCGGFGMEMPKALETVIELYKKGHDGKIPEDLEWGWDKY